MSFKVGDVVRYAPQWRSEGEEKYIHIVVEVDEERNQCLIETQNSALRCFKPTERVTFEMIEHIEL